MVCYRIIL